jgi:DNA-binding GntR family transcriptional regulator
VNFERLNPPNISDLVYEQLRERILRHEFAPGQRLDLPEMEHRLGISRTPLKDALARLESQGLVEIHARRGTFVATIDALRLDEAYKIRSAFELYVALCLFKYLTSQDMAQLKALRLEMEQLASDVRGWRAVIHDYLDLDRRLHELFVERGGPPRMLALFQQLNVHMQVRFVITHYGERDFEAIHFEHEQVFAALESQRPDHLHAALLNHLEGSRMRVLKNLAKESARE